MTHFPVEHLSASSINRFLTCPEQWRTHYILGIEGDVSEPLVVGSAFHIGMSRLALGQSPGDYFGDAIAEEARTIVFNNVEAARAQADTWLYHYWEQIGKHLDVEDAEREFEIWVDGVDIPIIGFIDLVLAYERMIDYKTSYVRSNYFLDKEGLKPDWRTQAHIYQLVDPFAVEFHCLTLDKKNPLIVPDSTEHKLYVNPPDPAKTKKLIRDTYRQIKVFMEEYGPDEEWPGNPHHSWTWKYCAAENCCGKF